jgi:hypothetical protein
MTLSIAFARILVMSVHIANREIYCASRHVVVGGAAMSFNSKICHEKLDSN